MIHVYYFKPLSLWSLLQLLWFLIRALFLASWWPRSCFVLTGSFLGMWRQTEQALWFLTRTLILGFLGGPVVKNPPANAGDMERFHMLQGNWAHELQLVKPVCSRGYAPQQEKPPRREAKALQLGSSPRSLQLEKTCAQTSPWSSPGQNTGVGSLSLLQGIFPTQGSSAGLPHCRQILYQLSHKGRTLKTQHSQK